jgi:uncharacterized protein YajQ (UPF0234 family)
MPSFDASLEANMTELRNAVDQASKEIATRFDFKGTSAKVEQKDRELTVYADSEFQIGQVRDVLIGKCAKRGVDVRFLDLGSPEKIGGDKIKQPIKIRHGIASDDAKKIVRIIKDSKMKVQAAIQGDAVRITGAKRDDLQAAIALLKKEIVNVRQLSRLADDSGPGRMVVNGLEVFGLHGVALDTWQTANRNGNITHEVLDKFGVVISPLGDIFLIGPLQ